MFNNTETTIGRAYSKLISTSEFRVYNFECFHVALDNKIISIKNTITETAVRDCRLGDNLLLPLLECCPLNCVARQQIFCKIS